MSRKIVFLALSCAGAFACASKVLPTDDQWVAAQTGARPAIPEPDHVKTCKRLLAQDDTRAATAGLALRAH